ncbi:MAG: hypothetical protein JXR64_13650, partial [Spirochaetales bacterium]|nr:hypothetical protein [Spirochaetales bacterium]
DYRWYAEDLTHPSSIAIDYILGRFLEKTVDSELSAYISRVLKINKMVNHRVINSDSESYLTFKEDLRRKLVQLQKDYKHLKILNSAKLSQYL